MQEYKLGKSTMERYDIRLQSGYHWRCAWAIISISDDGIFNAQTDCGDFSYRWGSFGSCFKSFLIDVCSKDTSYLYRKISDRERESKVDMEQTIKNMKLRIIQQRREVGNSSYYGRNELTPSEARDLWDALEMLDHSELSNDAFVSLFYHDLPSDERRKVFSDEIWYEDVIVNTSDRRAQAFCEVIAPVFAEILKNELKADKGEEQ